MSVRKDPRPGVVCGSLGHWKEKEESGPMTEDTLPKKEDTLPKKEDTPAEKEKIKPKEDENKMYKMSSVLIIQIKCCKVLH